MRRRDFLKYSAGGAAALVVGKTVPGFLVNEVQAAAQTLNFTITDAVKNMVTHNDINQAQCYFWIYKEATLPPEVPGPHIFVQRNQVVDITITNQLDEPHNLFIPGILANGADFDTGPIAPNGTVHTTFRPAKSGTFLYFDNLNGSVNRVMGLHGAMVVMPDKRRDIILSGHSVTPFDNPPASIQQLYDDFGSKAWWPGLAWHQGHGPSNTAPFRQYIWLLHQASPNLFAQVQNDGPGSAIRVPANFENAFLRDTFSPTKANNIPQYFTISGQSGHFSHNNPYNNPNNRVGEPVLIRILNAGLWTHSMHIHANHVYVIGINGVPQDNPFWVDVFTVNPMDIVEWAVPYMRPPDVPNERGIGRADLPQITRGANSGFHRVWPPIEELNTFIPTGLSAGAIDLSAQLSPLCYPMHDHSEPSQTAQGGNYNLGMIAGLNFIGDRNVFHHRGVYNFPNQPVVHSPGCVNVNGVETFRLGIYPPTVGPPWF